MPTFDDPGSDAREAREALHALAHATRSLADPSGMYTVLGDLVGGLRALRQVLDQLAAAHLSHQTQAGDHAEPRTKAAANVLAVADSLHQAGGLIDQSQAVLDEVVQRASRIAGRPAAAEAAQTDQVQRWVSVVFLHGEEADEILDRINRDGDAATIDYLTAWDYGDETTDAALANGHVYDYPETFGSDRQARVGDYALTYNYLHAHVALYRRHTIRSDDTLDERRPQNEVAPPSPAAPAGQPSCHAQSQGRGITL
ncbi:hypothetical protein [Microlunatus sp. GCM10028923]|uniref:hypothetical protein n=1 Tax=Microlunatus sp. GCM10028923 TaxID=3273400 RepID=UPI00360C01C6